MWVTLGLLLVVIGYFSVRSLANVKVIKAPATVVYEAAYEGCKRGQKLSASDPEHQGKLAECRKIGWEVVHDQAE